MIPSADRQGSLLALVRHFWMDIVIQSVVLGLIVVGLTFGVGREMPQPLLREQTQAPEHHRQADTQSLLPLSMQPRIRLRQRRLTEVTMTAHTLTAAHFFGHRATGELSAEKTETSKKG